MFKDPVCGMHVDETLSDKSIDYQGQKYYFCSQPCKEQFDAKPESYADNYQKEVINDATSFCSRR